jgi:Xaa-Pro dipeptidase
MSKNDFSIAEFEDRRRRVREAMRERGLDWLICFHPVSILWLTGAETKSYQEFQCLLIAADDGQLVVLTREGERNEFLADALVDRLETWGGPEPADPLESFASLARDLRLHAARVGIEVPAFYLEARHYLRLRELLGAALVAEPTALVHDLKLVKSPAEIGYIREAAVIADIGIDTLVGALRPGRTELAIAGEVIAATMAAGSGIAASPMNLVTGPRTAFSHGAPTLRRLEAGDPGNIEFGATSRRYTATIGRQFILGRPTALVEELFAVVRQAADAMIDAIRHGVPAVMPHEAARRVIAAAGYERGRVHTSGYGLAPGFPPTWGEPLHMFGGSTYRLEAGMVVTVEPPVFLGEEGLGARLIDNVLVTATGAELLSRRSRELIVVG